MEGAGFGMTNGPVAIGERCRSPNSSHFCSAKCGLRYYSVHICSRSLLWVSALGLCSVERQLLLLLLAHNIFV